MTTGEIIYAIMVAMQALLFLVGAIFIVAFFIKTEDYKINKLFYTAYILWAISPIFSIIGAFFGYFL